MHAKANAKAQVVSVTVIVVFVAYNLLPSNFSKDVVQPNCSCEAFPYPAPASSRGEMKN